VQSRLQFLIINMRVTHRCRDLSVTERALHDLDRRALLSEPGREGVAQIMPAKILNARRSYA
jgi:hypothetical protein